MAPWFRPRQSFVFRMSECSPPANPFPGLVFLSFPTSCFCYIHTLQLLRDSRFGSVLFTVHPLAFCTCSTLATANPVCSCALVRLYPRNFRGFLPGTNTNTSNSDSWTCCAVFVVSEKSIVSFPSIRVITNPLRRVFGVPSNSFRWACLGPGLTRHKHMDP